MFLSASTSRDNPLYASGLPSACDPDLKAAAVALPTEVRCV